MRLLTAAVSVLLVAAPVSAQVDVLQTRHNLSASGPGTIRAQSETQICIFCHVPHRALHSGNLSNRPESTAAYVPYSSTTLGSPVPGAPTGASRICMSCHDGTIALGQTVASGTIAMLGAAAGGVMPPGLTNLGTDLRRTHPVSFRPASSPERRSPPPGDKVQLDANGLMQCTSCHDPHTDKADAVQGDFLVKSNRQSAICTTCHLQRYWATNPSTHSTSSKRFDATLGANTAYSTVSDNGCESCHRPHSGVAAGGRLLKDTVSQTCLTCHAGQVAQQNVQNELSKPYAHPVISGSPALHDASEGPLSASYPLPETSAAAPRHAQCVDCHNPHASYVRPSNPPSASGFLAGVWGIDRNGARVDPVQNAYEVCFKCHADSANQPQRTGPTPPETVRRSVIDVNLRNLFNSSTAASFHPIEGPGKNTDVPSLIAPWTVASVMQCSDCHGSESSSSPAGPHGSVNRHILVASLTTADNTPESPTAYALCYRCHDRNSILSNASFPLHRLHVLEQRAPCTACHDWHGVSALQGTPVNNAHLINFDISIVQTSNGQIAYRSTGARHGSCTLSCHGEGHNNFTY